MNSSVPRLRMFAGPNGSGKSTLKSVLTSEQLGVYLNPDEIELKIRESGFFRPGDYGCPATHAEALSFIRDSTFLANVGRAELAAKLDCREDGVIFDKVHVDSYFASVAAAFLRGELIKRRASFTMETVMSSPDKVEVLRHAKDAGYRTYLYYVATADPLINISRVQNRVAQGGHDVPLGKIESRYYRSLNLLVDAIRQTNRAFIFDNSKQGSEKYWLAEVTDGTTLEIKTADVPAWFKHAVLDRLNGPP
jgi:predicted ABC-type ATPase